jgi:hypothetical protein
VADLAAPQLPLHLVEPFAVDFEQASAERVVKEQVALPVRDRLVSLPCFVALCLLCLDFVAQREQRLESFSSSATMSPDISLRTASFRIRGNA